MGKAILVLDEMPENCLKCKYHRIYNGIADAFSGWCPICAKHVTDDDETESRPDWCPLRPMPQKQKFYKRHKSTDVADEHFVFGWNQCIEALTRKR